MTSRTCVRCGRDVIDGDCNCAEEFGPGRHEVLASIAANHEDGDDE